MPSYGDVIDEIPVARLAGDQGAEGARPVQAILVTGVIYDPEICHHVGFNAPAAIAIDHVVDHQRRRGVRRAMVISPIAEIEDDSVTVGVFTRAVVLAGDDIVGDDVMETGIAIEPLVAIVGNPAGPAITVPIVVDDVV